MPKCPKKRAVRNRRRCQSYQCKWNRSLLCKLYLRFHLHLYFRCVSSEGCGQPVQVHRLAKAFAAQSLGCCTMRLVPISLVLTHIKNIVLQLQLCSNALEKGQSEVQGDVNIINVNGIEVYCANYVHVFSEHHIRLINMLMGESSKFT